MDHLQGPYCDYIRDTDNTEVVDDDDDDEEGEEVEEHPDEDVSAWSLGAVIQQPPAGTKVVFPTASWSLPTEELDSVTVEESHCLSLGQVWWPQDRQCYTLLTQGPCQAREWMVLERDKVVCKHRACPCDPARPEFCEVEVADTACRCRVALAAAQDGLCDPGEQLLVTPYGMGVCGCIVDPPHTPWPQDGRCYPVHSRGPCDEGFVLRISHSSQEPVCQPGLCGEGQVLYQDGECYELGTTGPCPSLHILSLEPDTLEPGCVLNTSKVKRVYDIIPRNTGLVLDGPLSRTMKVGNCKLDSRGKCRKSFYVKQRRGGQPLSRDRNVRLYVKKRSPRKYLNWLKSFRKMKRN